MSFNIVFEIMISNINGDNCSKEQTINDLLEIRGGEECSACMRMHSNVC
jgi:hypothetical protein